MRPKTGGNAKMKYVHMFLTRFLFIADWPTY